MKIDQRSDDTLSLGKKKHTTFEEGKTLATEIGAASYVECSSKFGNNIVYNVFVEAVNTYLENEKIINSKNSESKCLLQ